MPEPGNPQALNRYSYVYNNPVRYTDPTGHVTGYDPGVGGVVTERDLPPPPPGMDMDRHVRLYWIQEIALAMSGQTQLDPTHPFFLTDVEAAARLYDALTPMYEQRFGPFLYRDALGMVADVGIVVGGVVAEGSILVHGYNRVREEFQNEDAYRLIRSGDHEDALAQYYIGYDHFRRRSDGLTAFRSDFAQPGENQVRHLAGGLVTASAHLGLGRSRVLDIEREAYDIALHEAVFKIWDQSRNKSLAWFGHAIRTYLAEDSSTGP